MAKSGQRGQSIIEVAFSIPFILILTLIIIEMGIVFSTYLAVLNATREGAIFASMYPTLIDSTCGAIPSPSCAGAHDSDTYGGSGNSVTIWNEYRNRIANESFVAVGEVLRAEALISSSIFYI